MLDILLETEIQVNHQISFDEANDLVRKLEVANLARDKFLAGQISLSDYCDILEMCDVNLDDYLISVESNLNNFGLI
ncbi:hypothetical protein LC593_32865 [Nostoc sp. CHAB 5844]|nr:hypothetical protein [Nostoc sp. CHAB 5844]